MEDLCLWTVFAVTHKFPLNPDAPSLYPPGKREEMAELSQTVFEKLHIRPWIGM